MFTPEKPVQGGETLAELSIDLAMLDSKLEQDYIDMLADEELATELDRFGYLSVTASF